MKTRRPAISEGSWPLEMRAETAAACRDEPSVDAFRRKVEQGIYSKPTVQKNCQQKWHAPPTLFPVVTGSFVVRGEPTGVTLTDTAFAELQEDGKIKLGDQYRRDLNDLASAWIMHERSVHSARPKQFRNRLTQISAALEKARKVSDINASNATPLDRHLLNWAINVPGASTFYEELQALEQQIRTIKQTLTTLQSVLPQDFGKHRPHNDTRMILHLANIYEAAGGKARIYASEFHDGGWADTAFRRFAHKYYAQLPLFRRRRPAGLDNALRDALGRRRQKG